MGKAKPTIDAPAERLLYSRRMAADLLSSNIATIVRLEADGFLKPIRLSRKERGRVFYTAESVRKLAQVGVDDAGS